VRRAAALLALVALALALTAVALKLLPFLPLSLADGDVESSAA